jgi:hypothetical protein
VLANMGMISLPRRCNSPPSSAALLEEGNKVGALSGHSPLVLYLYTGFLKPFCLSAPWGIGFPGEHLFD